MSCNFVSLCNWNLLIEQQIQLIFNRRACLFCVRLMSIQSNHLRYANECEYLLFVPILSWTGLFTVKITFFIWPMTPLFKWSFSSSSAELLETNLMRAAVAWKVEFLRELKTFFVKQHQTQFGKYSLRYHKKPTHKLYSNKSKSI